MSDGNRGTYNPDMNNFQPRVGFAYQVNKKTVVRGGWAIYSVPALFDISGIYQPGFSQATNIVPSADVGLTIRSTLANPFPDGVAAPPGNSNGPNTFLGRGIGRFNDILDYRNGQSMRWSLSMQRELPGQWVVEGGLRREPELRSVDRFQHERRCRGSTCPRSPSGTRRSTPS